MVDALRTELETLLHGSPIPSFKIFWKEFKTEKALELGFVYDVSMEEVINAF